MTIKEFVLLFSMILAFTAIAFRITACSEKENKRPVVLYPICRMETFDEYIQEGRRPREICFFIREPSKDKGY